MATEKKAARKPERTNILAIDIHTSDGKVLRLTDVSSFELSAAHCGFVSVTTATQLEKLGEVKHGTVLTRIDATALACQTFAEPKPARRRK